MTVVEQAVVEQAVAVMEEAKQEILKLRQEKAELLEAGKEVNALVVAAQTILVSYLIPDGIDADDALGELLGLLDGPTQRAAQSKWREVAEEATK